MTENSKEEYLLIQDAIVSDMEINDDVYTSISDDPYVIFEFGQKKQMTDIEIEMLECDGNAEAKIYYDLGNGLNENDMVSFTLQKGINYIDFGKHINTKVLRIDPTSEAGEAYRFGDILIHQDKKTFPFVWALLIILLFVISVNSMEYRTLHFIFSYCIFYYSYGFFYKDTSIFIHILFYIVLLFSVLFMNSLWKEVAEDDTEN